MGFSQTLKNSNSNTPVIPEDLDQSWEHGNHSKELVASSQSSVPKTKSKIHCTRHKTRGLNQIKSPEGTRRIGPPFPIKSLTRFQQSMDKINSNERNRGRGTQGRRPGETENSRTQYKSRSSPNQSEGVFIPAGPVRPVPGTGQTGWPAAHPVHDLIRRPRFFLRNEVFSAMPPS